MEKILLVEDEKYLIEIYKSKFSDAGFKVISSSNVKGGLKLAKKEKPDLILLDIILQDNGGDGILFLEKLRQNTETASLAVVILSNYYVPKLKKRAFRLGVKDYLLKTTYTPSELVDKVKGYLSNIKGL